MLMYRVQNLLPYLIVMLTEVRFAYTLTFVYNTTLTSTQAVMELCIGSTPPPLEV